MDREADLVDTCINNGITAPIEESAVCGHGALKALLASVANKGGKLWMSQRLTHNVEIDIIGKRLQLIADMREFFARHTSVLSYRTRTEGAGAITDVRYLNVGARVSFFTLCQGISPFC